MVQITTLHNIFHHMELPVVLWLCEKKIEVSAKQLGKG